MDWKAHRAHQLSPLPREGLAAMAKEISPGSRVVRVRGRLGGGLATATHAVELQPRSGKTFGLVIKRYGADDDTIGDEWGRLRFAHGLDLLTPEPLGRDLKGEWFGTPALVMTRLPGHPNVRPRDLDTWLREIAAALVTIQSVPLRKATASLRKVHRVEDWEPPQGLRQTDLLKRAVNAVRRNLPDALKAGRAIGHGDFHPGNLLWSRERLTGVVDWSAARIGPRAHEVAYCRADLAVLMGAGAAEDFGRIYEQISGQRLGEDLWVWDLTCGLAALRGGRFWVQGYREQGATDLTPRHVWPRVATLIRRALARL